MVCSVKLLKKHFAVNFHILQTNALKSRTLLSFGVRRKEKVQLMRPVTDGYCHKSNLFALYRMLNKKLPEYVVFEALTAAVMKSPIF
jgi:hypothetical protein